MKRGRGGCGGGVVCVGKRVNGKAKEELMGVESGRQRLTYSPSSPAPYTFLHFNQCTQKNEKKTKQTQHIFTPHYPQKKKKEFSGRKKNETNDFVFSCGATLRPNPMPHAVPPPILPKDPLSSLSPFVSNTFPVTLQKTHKNNDTRAFLSLCLLCDCDILKRRCGSVFATLSM